MQYPVPVHLALAAALSTAALAGCGAELGAGELSQAAFVCPEDVCGQNSPEVAHNGLWEASLLGRADAHGLSIPTLGGNAYLTRYGVRYPIVVRDGRLSAANKTRTLMGPDLVDSRIDVLRNGVLEFQIFITAVHQVAKFAAAPQTAIESYTMTWFNPYTGETGKSLCNQPLPNDKDYQADLLGLPRGDTVLFEGDRFDVASMTTSSRRDDTWFNFGCAGHTLAKLYLHRETVANEPNTVWERRQAMLKMFVADYCGVGIPFTLTGEPIAWASDRQPSYPANFTLTTLDARWNETGALCQIGRAHV